MNDLLLKLTLVQIPVEKWSTIWCVLNSREWPKELADLKLIIWSGKSKDERHQDIIPIMNYVQSQIGEIACLAKWNELHPSPASSNSGGK